MTKTICTDCRHYEPERGVMICARYAIRYPGICTDEVKECEGFEPDGAVSRIERLYEPDSDAQNRQIGGDHYAKHTIQPWDAMREWMTPAEFRGFLRGNAIKYIARCNDKGGVEDIEKAIHYLQQLAQEMRKCS